MDDTADRNTFQIGQREFEAEVNTTETVKSRSTSRGLKSVDVQFGVSDLTEAQDIASQARGAERIFDASGTAWSVISSTMTTDDLGNSYVSLSLTESENLVAEELSFLGISLRPERYLESEFGEVMLIQARTPVLSSDQVALLEDFLDETSEVDDAVYFPIMRVGVSDEPLSVRFGRVLWERHSEGRNYLLAFVTEEGDGKEWQQGSPNGWDPQLGRLVDAGAETSARLARLEAALAAAGILDSSDLSPVFPDDKAKSFSRARREFNRVKDLDFFF